MNARLFQLDLFETRSAALLPSSGAGSASSRMSTRHAPTEPAAIRLEGTIERVVYFNEENGYGVFAIRDSSGKTIRLVCTVVGAQCGQWVTATGAWKRHPQFGEQFAAVSAIVSEPRSSDGMEAYLGSGLIPGIGPEYARRLVGAFGAEVFSVLDGQPERVLSVRGIGRKRAEAIIASWATQRGQRDLMFFAARHGISTAKAKKIEKLYGERALTMLQSDPFRLAQEIDGIGFATADAIAQSIGVPKDSTKRIAAGLRHAVLDAQNAQGHAALPHAALIDAGAKLLGLEAAAVAPVLAECLSKGLLVSESFPAHGELVYTPSMRASEAAVALRLRALAAVESPVSGVDAAAVADAYHQTTGRKLSASQTRAFSELTRSAVSVLTGGPGVGKTTLLHAFLMLLRARRVRTVLCAPTGRAAQRLSQVSGEPAQTVHRLLEAAGRGFLRNAERPLETDFLIVDEASMLDLQLTDRLLDALPDGAGILFVGDSDQLPSVGAGLVLPNLIASGIVPVARLSEIFRQAEASRIVVNAHAINAGLMPAAGKAGDDFRWIESESPETARDEIVRLVSETLPRALKVDPMRDIQVLTPMHKGRVGTTELNQLLQQALNPRSPETRAIERFCREYREGDRVLQARNCYDKGVFNGELGVITSVDVQAKRLWVAFDGRPDAARVEYEGGDLGELLPAYAISIHKSQGSEFPVVVIPLCSEAFIMLQRSVLYTAVTRGKRLVVVVGSRKALEIAVRKRGAAERCGGLLSRLRAAA